jgi:molecular chaperone GrpE
VPNDTDLDASDAAADTAKQKPRGSRRGRLKALTEELRQAKEERDSLQQELAEIAERASECEDDRLRLLAEMDNMRKRAQRRLEEDRWALIAEISRPLLDVADNLERASQTSETTGAHGATLEGLQMVHAQLLDVLARYGVSPIEAVGVPFDFNVHEAIAQVPSDGRPDNEVVSEVARGYVLNGRLLRPSKVVVARVNESVEG